MIQPQQLRVLVAIRDHGSLTAAAQSLGYGVPTIAHHLASLERHFRVQLVERDRRGARLTPLGSVFVAEAEEILVRLHRAERLVITQRDLGLTTIRVGTFASIGSQLLPRAIRELTAQVQVQVEVVEAEPTDVVERLHAGELHAGLIYDSADDPAFATPDLELSVLLEGDFEVLVARDSPFARLPQIDLTDLVDADWICSRDENETSDRVLRRACHLVGFDPKVLMRTDDLNMIHGLSLKGWPAPSPPELPWTPASLSKLVLRSKTSACARRPSCAEAPSSQELLRSSTASSSAFCLDPVNSTAGSTASAVSEWSTGVSAAAATRVTTGRARGRSRGRVLWWSRCLAAWFRAGSGRCGSWFRRCRIRGRRDLLDRATSDL